MWHVHERSTDAMTIIAVTVYMLLVEGRALVVPPLTSSGLQLAPGLGIAIMSCTAGNIFSDYPASGIRYSSSRVVDSLKRRRPWSLMSSAWRAQPTRSTFDGHTNEVDITNTWFPKKNLPDDTSKGDHWGETGANGGIPNEALDQEVGIGGFHVGNDATSRPPGTKISDDVGSAEFVGMVKTQFELLVAVLNASRVVLFSRKENPDPDDSLEFVPLMMYPEQNKNPEEASHHVVQGGGKLSALQGYPLRSSSGGDLEAPGVVEHADGSLTAPLVYASCVLGLVTIWRNERSSSGAAAAGDSSVAGLRAGRSGTRRPPAERSTPSNRADPADAEAGSWTTKEKDIVQKVARSLAMGAALEQKSRRAGVGIMQVEPLRSALAECIHQVKHPVATLRTFGKLLLGRLPVDDTLNRELVRDMMIQSDRLVDLLLPVDSIVGLLAQAVQGAAGAGVSNGRAYGHSSPGGRGAMTEIPLDVEAVPVPGGEWAEDDSGFVPRGVQDAMPAEAKLSFAEDEEEDGDDGDISYPPVPSSGSSWAVPRGDERSGDELGMLMVHEAVEPVIRAAQAVAQARSSCHQWDADGHFERLFVMLGLLTRVVINNPSQFFSIGCCHLKDSWNGIVCLLTSKDADNKVDIAAFVLAPKESKNVYQYLVSNVKRHPGMDSSLLTRKQRLVPLMGAGVLPHLYQESSLVPRSGDVCYI